MANSAYPDQMVENLPSVSTPLKNTNFNPLMPDGLFYFYT